MDCETAVALSVLRGISRIRLAEVLRGTRGASAGKAPSLTLEILAERLELRHDVARQSIAVARNRAAAALVRASALGIEAISWLDTRYPSLLAAIPDPPPVLWVRGDATALAGPTVAIVGSRAASAYALQVASHLATDLALHGVIVVSGLARGVDAASHRGALDGSGRTIAVLGSGADVVYPAEHGRLASEVMQHGALVSELLPGTPARPGQFPLRNRIISGLSLAVVIVEASDRSGSLITARCAAEQGRDVMAVPGNILSGRNRGSHGLLKDGAKMVENVTDILEELNFAAVTGSRQGSEGRSGVEHPILRRMAEGELYDVDSLTELTGLSGPKLLPRLLELELAGRITRAGGGRFMRGSS